MTWGKCSQNRFKFISWEHKPDNHHFGKERERQKEDVSPSLFKEKKQEARSGSDNVVEVILEAEENPTYDEDNVIVLHVDSATKG